MEAWLAGLSRAQPVIGTQIQTAWVHFLSAYEWQWFCTCTFREAVHPERADKAFRYWVGLIDESRLGHNYQRRSKWSRRARWVRALEWQKREVLHYHALIGNLGEYDGQEAVRHVWRDEWNKIAGFAKVEVPRSIGDVSGYVAKYVAKGGEIDVSRTLCSSLSVRRVSIPTPVQAVCFGSNPLGQLAD